jgi:hypothetical protein
VVRAGGGLGTLLGPEGTGPSAPDRMVFGLCVMGLGCFFWMRGRVRCAWLGVSARWSRLFFENYTVDASISDRGSPFGVGFALRFVDRFVCSSF